MQTLYKTQVKELKEEIEEKNRENLKKIQELQNEKYVHFTLEHESLLQQSILNLNLSLKIEGSCAIILMGMAGQILLG